jgi:hypothetical protein
MFEDSLMAQAISELNNFLLSISNVHAALLLAIALFLAQIMRYVQKNTDEIVDMMRKQLFQNEISRRTIYNLSWAILFVIGYAISPLNELVSRLLFGFFFAMTAGYLIACFMAFCLSVYMLAYDILSVIAWFHPNKHDGKIQGKEDKLENE